MIDYSVLNDQSIRELLHDAMNEIRIRVQSPSEAEERNKRAKEAQEQLFVATNEDPVEAVKWARNRKKGINGSEEPEKTLVDFSLLTDDELVMMSQGLIAESMVRAEFTTNSTERDNIAKEATDDFVDKLMEASTLDELKEMAADVAKLTR